MDVKTALDFFGDDGDLTTNSTVYKREKKREDADREGFCDRCPYHGGENARRGGKKARSDHYKDRRKGK
jgi:hypothetical protein